MFMLIDVSTHSFVKKRKSRSVVLSIAGSDSAAMAGIQMDSRCCESFDVHCATAITAVTAQNSDEFIALNPIDPCDLKEQIQAALKLKPQSIKIGLIAACEQVHVIAECIKNYLENNVATVVYDPVMRATSGAHFFNTPLLNTIRSYLLPLCTVVTPNIPEAEQLSGLKILNKKQLILAAKAIRTMSIENLIIKGGHTEEVLSEDFFCLNETVFSLSGERVITENTRGTGCAFSSFIAASLALGYELRDACVLAKMAIQGAIKYSKPLQNMRSCVSPLGFPKAFWPKFSKIPFENVDELSGTLDAELRDVNGSPTLTDLSFPSCIETHGPLGLGSLGLYPIVDSVAWLERLLPLGITTVQLRNKELIGHALEEEVEMAVELCQSYNCRLFINDHWQLAIDKGAYGVHLGQEDLLDADLRAIKQSGLRLGISNHCHFEFARALAIKPSYLACGPIFATNTKDMPWVPHGLDGLKYWKEALGEVPLVAIGGIDDSNIDEVAATGVSGVALISAITSCENPEEKAADLLRIVNRHNFTIEASS